MEERRKHPDQCLMQEEWGMIKQYMKATSEETATFRNALRESVDQIHKENKERFDLLMAQMCREETKITTHMKDVDDRFHRHKAEATLEVALVDGRVSRLKTTAGQIIFWGVASLISFATLWGGLTAVVIENTKKWTVIEPEHNQLMQDVDVLQEKSNHGKSQVS